MTLSVANRLDLRPAAELLGDWPVANLFASSIERVKRLSLYKNLLLSIPAQNRRVGEFQLSLSQPNKLVSAKFSRLLQCSKCFNVAQSW